MRREYGFGRGPESAIRRTARRGVGWRVPPVNGRDTSGGWWMSKEQGRMVDGSRLTRSPRRPIIRPSSVTPRGDEMTTWSRRLRRVSIAVLLTLAIHPTGDAQAPGETREPLPAAAPASVGFSEERLMRLDARMKRFVDEGQHAGIVMLLARKGRVVAWRT